MGENFTHATGASMPFQSKAQQRKCYALKRRGKAKTWNCNAWSQKSRRKRLPDRKRRKK